MKVIQHPASRGLTWLRAGIQIIARQPLALFLLTFIQLIVLMLPMMLLPLVGSGISTALMPVLYLGLMIAIRTAEQGDTPTPMHLFEPFGAEANGIWKQLMMFGLISGVFMLIAVTLSRVIVPPPEVTNIDATKLTKEEAIEIAISQVSLLGLAAILSIPVQMASWFAPMFIAWHGQGIGKAMFFSVVAVWRNKWPFLVLFAGWTIVIIVITLAVSMLLMILGFPIAATNAMMIPLLVVFMASAYCTFWVTYRDIVQ